MPFGAAGLQVRVVLVAVLSHGVGLLHRCNLPMKRRALTVTFENVHLSLLSAGRSIGANTKSCFVAEEKGQ